VAPDRPVPRAASLRWAALGAVVALVVLVVVLLVGGGAPQPVPDGLPDPGPVTGWGLPVARLLAELAAMASVGLLLTAALLLPSPRDALADLPARAVALAARAATVWLLAVVAEAVLTVSEILGAPPGQVLDPTLLRSFLGQTSDGRALLVQAVLVVVVCVLARTATTTRAVALGCVVALVALVPPALTGHAASTGSHELAVASLAVHVLAASVWVGGLAGLAWAAAQGSDTLRHAVPRYSTVAGWCFVAVAVSGVVNAGVRLQGFTPLGTSAYGGLVLAKVAALTALGAFGWHHRRRGVPDVVARAGTASGRRETARLFFTVAAAELVVMAATVGLAVGLSRTPTPPGAALARSPAAELLGFPMPGPPSLRSLLLGWVPDGFALTFLVVAALLYARGIRSVRRRGDAWPWGRVVSWYAALVVFAWATIGGLGLYSHVMFSAHMVAHMLLSMVVPIGLVLGAPVTLAMRALPGPRVRGELGPRQLLLAVLHSRPFRVVTHPLLVLALFVASLYALYFTPLFPTLMHSHLGHVAMEFHFVAVGCLFFFVLVGIDPTPWRIPPIARIGLLFAAMPFHAFFSIAIMSGDRVLAPAYFRALHRPFSTDLLGDQHLGGGIGWAMGELPILLVLGAVFVQWARSDQREADRFDRVADRAQRRTSLGGAGDAPAGSDPLADYNAYLASLAAHDARDAGARDGGTPR
jgi:putative copper resistance protein D